MRREKIRRLQGIREEVDRIQPILQYAEDLIDVSAQTRQSGSTIEDVIAMSRRAAFHVKAPPEYQDPTGTNIFCIPGYGFPCPDQASMLKSTLAHASQQTAANPVIKIGPRVIGTKGIFTVLIESFQEGAQFMYTINEIRRWILYKPAEPFTITAPGQYIITAVAQMKGQLPSQEVKEVFQLEECPDEEIEAVSSSSSVLKKRPPDGQLQDLSRKIRVLNSEEVVEAPKDQPETIPETVNQLPVVETPQTPVDTEEKPKVEKTMEGNIVQQSQPEKVVDVQMTDDSSSVKKTEEIIPTFLPKEQEIEKQNSAPSEPTVQPPPAESPKSAFDALLFGGDASSEDSDSSEAEE